MDLNSFFKKLENQYSSQLPFVVYKRPIQDTIKCWLQNDDCLHTTTNFSESGFVFAPFDLSKKTILLPKVHCEYAELDVKSEIGIDNTPSFSLTVEDELAKQNHINLVQKGISEIENGQLEKVVLSRKVEKHITDFNPIEVFKRLLNTYKNAMVYCWYHPKVGLWIGATPELLFKVEGKQLTTIALAGTQAVKATKEVSWTSKEIDEQQIVVDYIKNQIAPYSEHIKVSDTETIRAGSLLHLKSRVKSQITSASNLKSIIEALHPTPAVCGFPKQVAKDFIFKHEDYNREYYTGFLGELNLKQSKTRNTNRRNVENNAYTMVKTQSSFYVNLRCAQIKNDKAVIYVGGGITKDSIAENEWEETVNKTKTINSVLE